MKTKQNNQNLGLLVKVRRRYLDKNTGERRKERLYLLLFLDRAAALSTVTRTGAGTRAYTA